MSTLYLVGTPIGNLEDITLRALRVLRTVPLIAAEDTRTTGRLLHHFQIETPLTSFHEYSRSGKLDSLLRHLEQADLAVVTDAGMPGFSDPGFVLVRAALAAGHTVSPIPGPTAASAALVSSGLPTEPALFLGFLPRQATARRRTLEALAALPYTLVLYEAPHRLLDLLHDCEVMLGDRQVCVGRELTKLHEELWRGSLSQARRHFGAGPVRGEVTLVLAGAATETIRWEADEVRRRLAEMLDQGETVKEAAARLVPLSGWRKKEIYQLANHPHAPQDSDKSDR